MSTEITSIKNPILINYLQGKTNELPLKELAFLFENPEENHSFLDVLQDRLSLAIMKAARTRNLNFSISQVERSLCVIFETTELLKNQGLSSEEKLESLIRAGAAFRYLWMLADKYLV